MKRYTFIKIGFAYFTCYDNSKTLKLSVDFENYFFTYIFNKKNKYIELFYTENIHIKKYLNLQIGKMLLDNYFYRQKIDLYNNLENKLQTKNTTEKRSKI